MIQLPYIIAEIASAHEGSPAKLRKLANAAIKSGATAIKFQIFKRSNLLSQNNSLYDDFGKIEIPFREWKAILDEYTAKNIDIITEIFDYESLKIIKYYDCHIKVPSASIADKKYLNEVSQFDKKIFLAVGGSNLKEISDALKLLSKVKDVILLAGFQNFPTKIEDSNLSQINLLKTKFNLQIGYADHIDAEDLLMRFMVPSIAYSLGARYIEKHITLDRSLKGRDYYSSLNPPEFKEFVNHLKSISKSFGDPKNIGNSDAELAYKKFSKKYAVANRDIAIGEKCYLEDFYFLRTGEIGISENDIKKYLNKKIKKGIKRNDTLLPNFF